MAVRPTIALLTDFGLDDHYVGVMKGVLADRCPEAIVVDLTHAVPPHDVRTAAFMLPAAVPYFPSGTVFLVVVDPGVGTSRTALAAESGAWRFVGPDNGVFDLAFRGWPPTRAVAVRQVVMGGSQVGRTFEGRDRFAPAAAALARGEPLENLGAPMAWAPQLAWPAPRVDDDSDLVGEVVHVDRFGNLVTNLDRAVVGPVAAPTRIVIGAHLAPLVDTYGQGVPGALVALFNSADWLEIAVVGGNAARHLGVGRGAPVRVGRGA